MTDGSSTESSRGAGSEGWQEFASFVVYFERKLQNGIVERRTKIEQRTAIHHMETSEQANWPGIAGRDAWEWMLSRLPQAVESPVPAPARSRAKKPSRATPRAVFVRMNRIQLYQPPQHAVPQVLWTEEGSPPAYVAADAPLRLEASFTLEGRAGQAAAAERPICEVSFRARDRSTAVVTELGTTKGTLAEEGSRGTAGLSVLHLAGGEYRLEVTVALRDGPAGAGYGEVPYLYVM